MQKFIGESAIYQEAEIVKSDPKKAIYRMVLQTCDEVNQNKRLYPKKVLSEGMQNAKERIDRKLPGEMDHPLIQGNEQYDGMRQTTVLLKEVSHYIRDYEFRGNHLIGECETASTINGMNLLGMLKDKMVLGKSMRGMAELENKQGVNYVQSPLYIITFDAVSLPSHKAALVNFGEMRFESKNILVESNCGTICLPNGVCYLSNYVDMLIESKVIKFFDRWV
jgi:hypothetical protein